MIEPIAVLFFAIGLIYQMIRGIRIFTLLELGFIILLISEIVNVIFDAGILSIFLNLMAPIVIYKHYENRNKEISGGVLYVILISTAIASTLVVVLLTLPELPQLSNYLPYLDLAINSLSEAVIAIVFGYAAVTNYRTAKLTDERSVRIELIGSLFFAVGFAVNVIFRLIAFYNSFPDPFTTDIQSHDILSVITLIWYLLFFIFSTGAISIFLINIIINPNFAYNLPIPIANFMVYNENGIAVYSKSIDVPDIEINIEDQLLSGALKAVSAIIEETLGSEANLDHFDAGKFQIYFHRTVETNLTLVALTQGKSPFIERSLTRFGKELDNDEFAAFNQTQISNQMIRQVDQKLQEAFPYIQLD